MPHRVFHFNVKWRSSCSWRKMTAIFGPILGFVLLCLGLPLSTLDGYRSRDGSANSTVRPGVSSDGRVTPEERQKRVQRIGSISDCAVGKRVGRGEQSRRRGRHSAPAIAAHCRVALERLKLQIDDLASLPEVRRADATVTRRNLGPAWSPCGRKHRRKWCPVF